MRRLLFVLGAVMALVVVASPASAQIRFGVHGSYIAGGYGDIADLANGDLDLSGNLGLGGRLMFSPPALPISLYGAGTYFFPSCEAGDCNYWTGALGGQLGLPLPALRPYLLGGWQWKSYSLDGFDGSTESNAFFGVGLELKVLAGLFIEGQWEFDGTVEGLPTTGQELSVTPFVITAGILIGD